MSIRTACIAWVGLVLAGNLSGQELAVTAEPDGDRYRRETPVQYWPVCRDDPEGRISR